MRFFKLSLKLLMVFCVLLLFTTQARALPITPDLAIMQGLQNNMPDILAFLAEQGIPADAELLYKSNVGGAEEGSLASSYNTAYSNTPSDPSGATITYQGGKYVGGDEIWLLIKDGKQDPAWYLFDLDELGWDGISALILSSFWPGNGAISNVSLYGTPVSEPATMLLLGFGLVGLAVFGRKRFLKGA